MRNFPKVSAAIVVLGLVASVWISKDMRAKRVKEYKIGSEARQNMVYIPAIGFDKFYADYKWMMTINQLGHQQGKMQKSEVDFFYGQLQHITNLDPDFDLAYKVGASHIAYFEDANLAIDLMNKADGIPERLVAKDDPKRKEKLAARAMSRDWYRPYQAAHWIQQIRARTATNEKERKKHFDEALAYIDMALQAGDTPWYVENMYLHTLAKRDGDYGDSYKELQAWNRHYNKRLHELKSNGESQNTAPDGPSLGSEANIESKSLTRLRVRITERCREEMLACLTIKGKGNADKELQKKMNSISNIFKKVSTTPHYSSTSLAAYDAGDLYDRASGTPVVPYGMDLYDYEINGRITLAKGAFNTNTGKKAITEFDALKKELKKDPVRLAAQYQEYLRIKALKK